MLKEAAAHELLHFYWERKRAKNPGLSLRRIASQLGLSPSYLSRVFRGQKALAPRHLAPLADQLEMDEISIRRVQVALIKDKIPRDFTLPRAAGAEESFAEAAFPTYDLLGTWYQVALLDLISVKDFRPSAAWIAKRLRITEAQAKSAWKKLNELELIEQRDGRWVKTARLLRFPTQRTHPLVRKFHIQHLELAKQELEYYLREEDFKRRLISGTTMAVNPEKIPQAREVLLKAMHEVTALLTEGECSEVYHCNFSLFPLTK